MRRRRAGKTVAQLWINFSRLTKTRAVQSAQVVQVKHSISPAPMRAVLLHNVSLFGRCIGHIKYLSIHVTTLTEHACFQKRLPAQNMKHPPQKPLPASMGQLLMRPKKLRTGLFMSTAMLGMREGPMDKVRLTWIVDRTSSPLRAIADMQHYADCRNEPALQSRGAVFLLPSASTASCSPDQHLHHTNMNTTVKAPPGFPVGQPQKQPILPDTSAMAGPAQCQEGHACIPNDLSTGHKVPADVQHAEGHAACISRVTAGVRMAGSQALSNQKMQLLSQPAAPSSHGEVAIGLPYIGKKCRAALSCLRLRCVCAGSKLPLVPSKPVQSLKIRSATQVATSLLRSGGQPVTAAQRPEAAHTLIRPTAMVPRMVVGKSRERTAAAMQIDLPQPSLGACALPARLDKEEQRHPPAKVEALTAAKEGHEDGGSACDTEMPECLPQDIEKSKPGLERPASPPQFLTAKNEIKELPTTSSTAVLVMHCRELDQVG